MIGSVIDLTREQERCAGIYPGKTTRFMVCAGTGCVASGSRKLYDALVEMAGPDAEAGVEMYDHECDCEKPTIMKTGCQGPCAQGPLVQVEPSGVLYTQVTPSDIKEIYMATVRGEVVERLLYRDPDTGERYQSLGQSPFYRKQRRLVLSNCGKIDPEQIEEYLSVGGYRALAKALSDMSPQQVCAEVLASGLRGRGGAGFPTGRKWEFVRTNPSPIKYVICNGDEGDPGAFMNGSLMEGDPHRVLEGLIIAGYAQGASQGIFYVRAEYPLAVARLKKAIADAEAAGLLGDRIMGSDFSFHVKFKEGAGAFVCGEETALMASVEGKRGMPRPKPPFPAKSGIWGYPTTINNVETLAHVPGIILNGSSWFHAIGTPNSPGTKTFSLTGKITNTGLVEVPMGVTLREMVYDIGGGIPNGKKFKALQIGGPSGGCLTEQHLDLGLDFDSLQSVGAMVGSGGLVVIDEDNCIIEVARFFMEFIQAESCGKCVACREGTKQMLALLQKIVDGHGTVDDLALLEEVAMVVKDASLCGLGKTAANPVLTTMRYFRDEYMAHVRDRRCPAHACQAYKEYYVIAEKCTGCGRCARACPSGAIIGWKKEPHIINQKICISCGACVETCRFGAVEER